MAYSLSPWLKPRFFITGTNRPLAGGLLYTYKAGTTDNAKTYSDDTGTENTNPIVLNSDGECDLYLDDAVSYRFILKNSAGVTQFDKDRVASLGSTQVQSFDNIAALRLRSGTTQANAAETLGYYSAGDGGGNSFYWDSASTATDNGGTVIKPTSVGGAGRWLAVDTSYINVKQFGAVGDGVADDTAAIQAAINYGASKIEIPKGTYIFTNIIINPSLREFIGSGSANTGTYLKRKTGATGAGIAWDGSNRVTQAVIGHFRMDGNSEVAETYGIDLSGFSYCTFQNMWIRAFRMDGVYADGSITPVNKQFSNNTFLSVRSNNNLRDGWRFDGGAAANSANTYIGCEGASNAGIGFNELYGYSNQTVGCTFQGNTNRDFYTNGSRNKHEFYAEGNPKPVELGAASFGNHFSVRSSYPLWNTFVDAGTQNIVSIRGEVEPEKHIFNNPFFLNWHSSSPVGISLNGSPVLASFSDLNSPAGAGVQATVNANFQGLIFSLSETKENLQGKWVTLILEIDTSGVVDTLNSRVYARDGSTPNSATGEFSVENLPVSASGTFIRLAYDVKFAASLSGTPTILWYMAYSGVSGSNVIKIRSARIVMGQTREASQYIGQETQHSATTTVLSGAANGVNTHRKYLGRIVYDTTSGRLRYAIGTAPTSAWRATDGSGDLTPT